MKKCALSGREIPEAEAIRVSSVRPLLLAFIRRRHPGLADEDWISREALDELRGAYIEASLQNEIGEITDIEREVIDSLRGHELMAERPEDAEEEKRSASLGDRLSDRIAEFGGSWTFIMIFCAFLILWMVLNVFHLFAGQTPDPYPFILLNLLLSCVAALQAPIIMMSQRRQEIHDRKRAMQDYQINLKAELEIRHLHEKIDHLLISHSERLMEIQQYQTELLQRLLHENGKKTG